MRRKYEINDQYFNSIDTEEKAYWFGFIAADGSIRTHGDRRLHYRLTINLAEKDKAHLEKLRKALSSNHPIKYRKKNKAFSLVITVKPLVEGLLKNGLLPLKEQNLRWPSALSGELQRHFLRGYFDGDGCFSMKQSKRWPAGIIHVLGNFTFLEGLRDFVYTGCNLNKNKISANHKSETTAFIQWSGNILFREFYDFIYLKSSICLDRKKNRAEEIITLCPILRKRKRKPYQYLDFGQSHLVGQQ
jgi:hypothetical protein